MVHEAGQRPVQAPPLVRQNQCDRREVARLGQGLAAVGRQHHEARQVGRVVGDVFGEALQSVELHRPHAGHTPDAVPAVLGDLPGHEGRVGLVDEPDAGMAPEIPAALVQCHVVGAHLLKVVEADAGQDTEVLFDRHAHLSDDGNVALGEQPEVGQNGPRQGVLHRHHGPVEGAIRQAADKLGEIMRRTGLHVLSEPPQGSLLMECPPDTLDSNFHCLRTKKRPVVDGLINQYGVACPGSAVIKIKEAESRVEHTVRYDTIPEDGELRNAP